MASPLLSSIKTKILIVDDDPKNLLAFEAILENLGHEILTARSGKEALALNAENDFAVILLDIMMPRWTALKRLLCCINTRPMNLESIPPFSSSQDSPHSKTSSKGI